jgi:hypothetical protein
MSSPTANLLSSFDGHDVGGVRAALQAGADRGKAPSFQNVPNRYLRPK